MRKHGNGCWLDGWLAEGARVQSSFSVSERPSRSKKQLVTLEEAQGAVENIEQGEAIVGVLRLVCQPLDPSVRDRHLVCDMKVAR